jgi:hypothetical protein
VGFAGDVSTGAIHPSSALARARLRSYVVGRQAGAEDAIVRGVLMTPLSGVGVKNLGLIAEARKHFGEITKENQAQVKAWIHQQLEARGETDQHFTPSGNVRKFEPVDRLETPEGWK